MTATEKKKLFHWDTWIQLPFWWEEEDEEEKQIWHLSLFNKIFRQCLFIRKNKYLRFNFTCQKKFFIKTNSRFHIIYSFRTNVVNKIKHVCLVLLYIKLIVFAFFFLFLSLVNALFSSSSSSLARRFSCSGEKRNNNNNKKKENNI